jgi:hypothetical protein
MLFRASIVPTVRHPWRKCLGRGKPPWEVNRAGRNKTGRGWRGPRKDRWAFLIHAECTGRCGAASCTGNFVDNLRCAFHDTPRGTFMPLVERSYPSAGDGAWLSDIYHSLLSSFRSTIEGRFVLEPSFMPIPVPATSPRGLRTRVIA